MESQTNLQSSLQILIFDNSSQNLHKSRCQSFLVLSNFAWISYYWENILSFIVEPTNLLETNEKLYILTSTKLFRVVTWFKGRLPTNSHDVFTKRSSDENLISRFSQHLWPLNLAMKELKARGASVTKLHLLFTMRWLCTSSLLLLWTPITPMVTKLSRLVT